MQSEYSYNDAQIIFTLLAICWDIRVSHGIFTKYKQTIKYERLLRGQLILGHSKISESTRGIELKGGTINGGTYLVDSEWRFETPNIFGQDDVKNLKSNVRLWLKMWRKQRSPVDSVLAAPHIAWI